MSSYLITGVSRGIGLAFLENLSSNPSNTVIGLVRDIPATNAKIAPWNRKNIHLIQCDITYYDALTAAATATSSLTSNKLDYLIANAALLPSPTDTTFSDFDPLSIKGQQPQRLEDELLAQFRTNVIAQIHLINLFMPLILNGSAKKVVMISSGHADVELARKYDVFETAEYSISKAAVNMAVAKFSAEYRAKGVLFLSVSPGVVDTANLEGMSESQGAKMMGMVGKFKAYSPDFAGAISPAESVKAVLDVVAKTSVEKGDGGAFVSHLYPETRWI